MTLSEQILRLPERMQQHRSLHELSLRQVETATGVARATLHRFELGANTSMNNLVSIARYLEESIP